MRNIHTGKMRCGGLGCPDRFSAGYTLIEMLTVMAIIAVLSTLVLSAVVNVKHRAQEVKCMNNLKQIAISTRFYLDDFVNPPRNLLHLHETGYLPNSGVLDCPNDLLGNWGELVSNGGGAGDVELALPPMAIGSPSSVDTSRSGVITGKKLYPDFSYLQAFHMRRQTWNALMAYGRRDAGAVACQLHGIRKDSLRQPSIYAYSGLVLRGNVSGSVVRKQIFWNDDDRARVRPGAPFLESNLSATDIDLSLWRFFSDSPVPTPLLLPRKTSSLYTWNRTAQDSSVF